MDKEFTLLNRIKKQLSAIDELEDIESKLRVLDWVDGFVDGKIASLKPENVVRKIDEIVDNYTPHRRESLG